MRVNSLAIRAHHRYNRLAEPSHLDRLAYFPVRNEIVFAGYGGNCEVKAKTE